MEDGRRGAGADVLAVQGNEAGGHTGRANLLPFLVQALDACPDVPVIAAGASPAAAPSLPSSPLAETELGPNRRRRSICADSMGS